MSTRIFQVRAAESRTPLVTFLAQRLALSKNKAKALIDQRQVFVNGRRVWMAQHAVAGGDEVEVCLPATAPATRVPLRILFQDADYVIADKPAGWLSNGAHSVETALRDQLKCATLEAMHRLDRDTSGCLLLAREPRGRDLILPLFANRSIHKTYHAIVSGEIRDITQTITIPLEGRPAATQVRTLDANRQASHLQITIETGRTHQIRKHLLAIRHPIIGEQHYTSYRPVRAVERQIRRQMLHAAQIHFRSPITGQAITGIASLPADFKTALRLFGLR